MVILMYANTFVTILCLSNLSEGTGVPPMTLAVHRGHIKIARLLHERDHPKRRIAGKIFYFFMTLFVILIIINEPDPDSRNYQFWVILLVCCLTCSFMKTVMNILIDIWFCRRISPILDY